MDTHSRALRLLAASSLLVVLLVAAPAALGSTAVTLSLDVSFSATGTITVTLPDGTPVGSTSGAPTVIPAGAYTLQLSAPGQCTQVPLFDLQGPGEHVNDDMNGGELNNDVINAYFLPNSTYTWRVDNVSPAVVHTFVTSANVVGTPVASTTSSATTTSTGSQPGPTSEDIVGSAIVTVPFRGTLTGAVSTAGKLTLVYKGKNVTSLPAGRYTITVTDRSTTSGFLLEKLEHAALSVTSAAFVGKHSASVVLTAGKWFSIPRLVAKTSYSIVVK